MKFSIHLCSPIISYCRSLVSQLFNILKAIFVKQIIIAITFRLDLDLDLE